jgi:GH24 family phage-related lysozyme (muramidase)
MSVAVSQPARESLNHTIAMARARAVENRRCDRRVRQEARDALAVVMFSAGASTVLALLITLLVTLAG